MARWVAVGAGLDCSGTGRGEAHAPAALRDAGVVTALGARDAGDISTRITDPTRDPATGVIAVDQLRAAIVAIRVRVADVLSSGDQPVVLGGDCTVAIGVAAALRQHVGRVGLVFIDGHPDYLDGASSPTGEAADMDLAIMTGHSSSGLVEPEGTPPLVDPADVVLVGHRGGDLDANAAAERARLPDVMTQLDSSTLIAEGGDHIGRRITANRTGPWWLHMDLDVLDEEALPAVTYPQPAGPGWDDLTALLAVLGTDHRLMGVTVADFRPDLDTHSRHARRIVDMLAATLAR